MTAKHFKSSEFPPSPPPLLCSRSLSDSTIHVQRQKQSNRQPSDEVMENKSSRSSPYPSPASDLPSCEASKQHVGLSESEPKEPIDTASIKGNFGWVTLDGINIPCLFRSGQKYLSVRMVDQKLLSKYRASYSDELFDRMSPVDHFMTANEAALLNEINAEHCDYEFGKQAFTKKDLIVRLHDFIDCYKKWKSHFTYVRVVATRIKSCSFTRRSSGCEHVTNRWTSRLKLLKPNAKKNMRLAVRVKAAPSKTPFTSCAKDHPRKSSNSQNFQHRILEKLDIIISNEKAQNVLLNKLTNTMKPLRRTGECALVEDLIPSPMDSIKNLEALNNKLEAQDFKKQLICSLSAFGGKNLSMAVSCIMRMLGTDNLWSQYSLMGRREKLSFQENTLYKVIIKACLRSHPKAKESDVEAAVSYYLRYAPSRLRRLKRKRDNDIKSSRISTLESSDEDLF